MISTWPRILYVSLLGNKMFFFGEFYLKQEFKNDNIALRKGGGFVSRRKKTWYNRGNVGFSELFFISVKIGLFNFFVV